MAQRGRPRKIPLTENGNLILQENKMSEAYLPKVHHIVRFLSLTGATVQQGAFSIADVDAYVSEWLDKGYDLFSTHYIDKAVEGYAVLYILVRKD